MALTIESPQSRKAIEKAGIIFKHRLLLLPVLLACCGCGNSLGSIVSGNVTVAGRPLSRGIVAFQPTSGHGPIASADINVEGNYQLSTGRNGSLPPGDYVVTVLSVVGDIPVPTVKDPNPKIDRLVHERYCQKETSGLKYTIVAGKNVINFDLDPPDKG